MATNVDNPTRGFARAYWAPPRVVVVWISACSKERAKHPETSGLGNGVKAGNDEKV